VARARAFLLFGDTLDGGRDGLLRRYGRPRLGAVEQGRPDVVDKGGVAHPQRQAAEHDDGPESRRSLPRRSLGHRREGERKHPNLGSDDLF
jgi:hypothetical protein